MITPSFSLTATERVLPRLALDFTTASLDPRVTFTRTTSASNPATYVNSSGLITLATTDQPRFDFNPVTLVCRGLLIEESRTNNIIQSNDFTGYILSNTAVVLSSGTSPDGTNNANKINELATTTTHFIRRDVTLGNAAYTVSIYAKAAERTAFALQLADGVAGGAAWKFDLTNGVSTQDTSIVAGSWTAISGSITNAGNGWYRCTLTATKGAGTIVSSRVHTLNAYTNGVTTSYLGVVDWGILAYGLQLETGAFATSYIPTTTTALTRNADVATMTGTNFSDWYNQSEGSLFVEGSSYSNTFAYAALINKGDLTDIDNIYLRKQSTNTTFGAVRVGAAFTFQGTGSAWALNQTRKLGIAVKLNNMAFADSGGASTTSTSANLVTAMTQMIIGRSHNNTLFFNGWISSIEYYPQRLTTPEVQSFSRI